MSSRSLWPLMAAILALVFVSVPSLAGDIYVVDYPSQADAKVYVVDYWSQADLCVYVVDYQSQAKGTDWLWHYVFYESQADAKVYFVEYVSQADIKIYFVDYWSQAGWRESNKFMGRLR